jgi:hypothetical protein
MTVARLIGCLVSLGDHASARSEADAQIGDGREGVREAATAD